MMDDATFQEFDIYQVHGSKSNVSSLSYLTEEETKLYEKLKVENLRLEQERIPQLYVDEFLKGMFQIFSHKH
jgi:hypothetical protein